jgi:hypothetical protein
MTKFLIAILLALSFLGGYYAGRIPGSPDLIAQARQVFRQASQLTAQALAYGNHAQDKHKPAKAGISD